MHAPKVEGEAPYLYSLRTHPQMALFHARRWKGNWSKSPSMAEGQMVAGASKNLPVGFLTRVPGQHLIMSEQQTGTGEPHGIQRMT